jgi:hypothetical protein
LAQAVKGRRVLKGLQHIVIVDALDHHGVGQGARARDRQLLVRAEQAEPVEGTRGQVEALDSAASEEEKPPPTPGSCSLLGLRTSWTSEPLAEITRTDTELALERAAQSAFRAKSCLVCNLRDLQSRGLQQGPSKLASQLLDRLCRRRGAERAEVTRLRCTRRARKRWSLKFGFYGAWFDWLGKHTLSGGRRLTCAP